MYSLQTLFTVEMTKYFIFVKFNTTIMRFPCIIHLVHFLILYGKTTVNIASSAVYWPQQKQKFSACKISHQTDSRDSHQESVSLYIEQKLNWAGKTHLSQSHLSWQVFFSGRTSKKFKICKRVFLKVTISAARHTSKYSVAFQPCLNCLHSHVSFTRQFTQKRDILKTQSYHRRWLKWLKHKHAKEHTILQVKNMLKTCTLDAYKAYKV